MRIISWNVNGIRAVMRKGFLDWFGVAGADVVCLQEIKASMDKIPADLFNLPGWHSYFNPAQKPGYAGTAVFSKIKPLKAEQGIGFSRIDKEGRAQILRFKDFTLFNFYMINGGGKEQNMVDKLTSYDFVIDFLKKRKEKNILIAGDFNVAHKEIDLARPKENKNNHGFTLPEREKIDHILELGFVDSFRYFYPNKTGAYTWWTHFANARARNLGWRIDYLFASRALAPRLKDAHIWPKVMGSDHCPAGLDIS